MVTILPRDTQLLCRELGGKEAGGGSIWHSLNRYHVPCPRRHETQRSESVVTFVQMTGEGVRGRIGALGEDTVHSAGTWQ